MVDSRDELHLERLEGVAIRDCDVDVEGAALIGRVLWAGKGAYEVEGRVCEGPVRRGEAERRR